MTLKEYLQSEIDLCSSKIKKIDTEIYEISRGYDLAPNEKRDEETVQFLIKSKKDTRTGMEIRAKAFGEVLNKVR